jgi:hypothetical protein
VPQELRNLSDAHAVLQGVDHERMAVRIRHHAFQVRKLRPEVPEAAVASTFINS